MMMNLSTSLVALFACFGQLLLINIQLVNGAENFNDFEVLKSQEMTRCTNKIRKIEANVFVEDKSPYEMETDPETNKQAKYNWQPCKNCNKFMGNGQQAYSVKQGSKSQNCWLMSVIIGLFGSVNGAGSVTVLFNDEKKPTIFGVMLYPDGVPTCVIVDGLIPHTDKGEIRFASSDDGALYPLIVEKALARQFGGYQALTACHLNEAHFYLTGGSCRIFSVNKKKDAPDAPDAPDVCNNADFCVFSSRAAAIEKIKKEYAIGSILYGNINIGSDGAKENVNGLVTGHTYAILEWISMDGIVLVKIYDQGRSSTLKRGEFSKNNPNWHKSQYRRIKEKYYHEVNKQGILFMTPEEMWINYSDVYACDIGPQNVLKKTTTGQFPRHFSDTDKMAAYVFEVTDSTVPIRLTLMQHHPRSSSSSTSVQHKLAKYRYPDVLILYKMGKSGWEYHASSCFEALFVNSIQKDVPLGQYLVLAYTPCPMTRLFSAIYAFKPSFTLLVYYDSVVSNMNIRAKTLTSLEYWSLVNSYAIATANRQKSICPTNGEQDCATVYSQVYTKKNSNMKPTVHQYLFLNPKQDKVEIELELIPVLKGETNENEIEFLTDPYTSRIVPGNHLLMLSILWDPSDGIEEVEVRQIKYAVENQNEDEPNQQYLFKSEAVPAYYPDWHTKSNADDNTCRNPSGS